MPQMSPMMWMQLMIYFIMMYIIIMILLYNFIMYLNMNNNMKKKLNFKIFINKW